VLINQSTRIDETPADTAGKESSMNPYTFVILALALVSFQPTASLSATNLTIGRSTINPRIAPLWIAQKKGYLMIAAMKAGTIPIAYGGARHR
jgi:hypothetical protein